jgi:type I restriction-modification system DNA methylase subunit
MDSVEIVSQLTEETLPSSERRRALEQFAKMNGWQPSDEIEYPATSAIANGHLVVEHGLQNAVVISFLRGGRAFKSLTTEEQMRLLSISYNNLIDWHFFPNSQGLTYVNILSRPLDPIQKSRFEFPDLWRAEAFDKIVGRRPNPNVKSLDDALVSTLRYWKRLLHSQIPKSLKNENISALFNAVLLVRALEDQKRWQKPSGGQLLVDCWTDTRRTPKNIHNCITKSLRTLGIEAVPKWLLRAEDLSVFDQLERDVLLHFLRDFYSNRLVPYPYDFSLMSKHALSRIYEHYVSILREVETDQMALFPQFPEEIMDRRLGGIYTPQYVARFFARFLRENLIGRNFRNLRMLDPACGSGIFPRTILELQCDPWLDFNSKPSPDVQFGNVVAIDVDGNACQATRLSLSLLFLVLTGRLPAKELNIINAEAIQYFESQIRLRGTFDVVVTNPPFISWDKMPTSWRKSVSRILADHGGGKKDMSLAFLKMGMEMLKDGGHLLYVLPHNFLISEAAQALRQAIQKDFFVLFLADLSQVPVFDKVGAYVILLVLQKKPKFKSDPPPAVCVRCSEFVGYALQDGLDRKLVTNEYYSVFEVDQSSFDSSQWQLHSPREMDVMAKLQSHPLLSEFLEVREGLITGADDIFVRRRDEIPSDEMALYRPLLTDRSMQRFRVPAKTSEFVFYPYKGTKPLDQETIRLEFPQSWAYLKSHEKKLKNRLAVRTQPHLWWRPNRPRKPENILQPKIVTPHLVLIPRFSLDLSGRFLVTRGPYLHLKNEDFDTELLYYFLAVLNSAVVHWQIANLSHKYGHGYFKLEKLTLEKIRIPDPRRLAPTALKSIDLLVRDLVSNPEDVMALRELDVRICKAYGLDKDDLEHVGIGI